MKKQVKVIIGIVVAIAILIAGISLFYPSVFKGLTSGTFGKADKYHKQQMTEKDILLRSNLVADTGQLKNMIQGLIYFSIFTEDLSNKIDSCVIAFKAQGMGAQAGEVARINVLRDYSDFIRNNNKTLNATIVMLTTFYLKDTTDQSQDVENNMRAFGNYVNNLTERDSVLNQALVSMDNFLLNNATIRNKKVEIASLKSIRDQLLIKGIQLSGVLQDKPLCSQLISYALSSQSAYNIIVYNKGQIGRLDPLSQVVTSPQNALVSLNILELQNAIQSHEVGFGSESQLREIMQSQQSVSAIKPDLGLISSAALVGSVIVYNSSSLKFIAGTPAQLSKVISAADMNYVVNGMGGGLCNIQAVAVFSTGNLCLVQSVVDLKNAVSAIASQGNFSLPEMSRVILVNSALQSQNYGNSCIHALQCYSTPQITMGLN